MLILSHRRWHNVDVSTVVNEKCQDVGRHETWENFRKALQGLEPSFLRDVREYTKLYKLLLNSILTYTKIIDLLDRPVSIETWSGERFKIVLVLWPIYTQNT